MQIPKVKIKRSDFEEQCINCGDALIAQVNWQVGDMMQDIRYCTKEPCQVAKPIVMTTTTWTGKGRKRTPPDTGLEHTLGQKARYVKAIPNQDKVKEFAHMLS